MFIPANAEKVTIALNAMLEENGLSDDSIGISITTIQVT